MPDLMSHALAAWAGARTRRSRTTAGLVVAGALIPDVLSVVPGKILAAVKDITFVPEEAFNVFRTFHTPLQLIPVCALIAFFFEEKIRGRVFACLTVGVGFHFFLDMFQYQISGGYMLLFPFSTQRFQFGLVWPDQWPYWLLITFIAALSVEILRRRKEKREEMPSGH